METGIYVGSVACTVLWSVYLHITWATRAKLPDEAPARFFLIIGPSCFLLAIVLAGWQHEGVLRLDLVGLIALDGMIVLAWIIMALYFALRHTDNRSGYKTLLIVYNVFALLLVGFIWLAHLVPTLETRVVVLVESYKSLDFFSFAWVAVDPEKQEQDLTSMLNKILIALLSYVPVSLIRIIYSNSKRRKITEEIIRLRKRVERLEQSKRVNKG